MAYLLDTNVISEVVRKRPDDHVLAWLAAQKATEVYLSVVTLGEIEQGIARAPHPRRAERLHDWLNSDVLPQFAGRVLPITSEVMRLWGQITGRALLAGRPVPYGDSLLAASALHHTLTLVTRNEQDVEALGVKTLNPWHK